MAAPASWNSRGLTLRQALLIVLVISSSVSLTLLPTQLRGEDELFVLRRSVQALDAVGGASQLMDGILAIATDNQPPGRNLLPVPFVAVLGDSEIALRLPNTLFWVGTALLGALIAFRLILTPWAALFAGVLIGGSGMFNVQAMGHGHGVLTFWIMALIYHLLIQEEVGRLRNRTEARNYVVGAVFIVLAFTWFTSAIVIAGLYHLLYAYHAIRDQREGALRRYLVLTLPFAGYYVLYYLIFIGVPAYLHYAGVASAPIGQFHQNLVRASTSQLGVTSFFQNLQGLNGYFLPFVSWVLLGGGVVYLWQRSRNIFWVTLGYGLLFSFYIGGKTMQHFLAYFTWIIPMAVAGLFVNWPRVHAIAVLSVLTLLVLAWSSIIHVMRYDERSFPETTLRVTLSETLWRNNVERPIEQIVADLQALLGPQDRFFVRTDGALPKYYFQDQRYIATPALQEDVQDGCLVPSQVDSSIRATVSFEWQTDFCPQIVANTLRYPGSYMQITVFR